MGSTTRRTRTARLAGLAGLAATTIVLAGAVTACRDADADQSDDAATAATEAATEEMAPADLLTAGPQAATDVAAESEAAGAEATGAEERAGAPVPGDATDTLNLPADAALAIRASARLTAADVRLAVDQVTTAVNGVGGRVASANVTYPTVDPEHPDATDTMSAYAALTLLVPPDQLTTVVDRLEEIGQVTGFQQEAEDVTEQLADLDSRIANQRASVERTRTLLAEAATLQDLVFVEGELTRRETELELLLAQQQTLQDRVAMSVLTVEVLPEDSPNDPRPNGPIAEGEIEPTVGGAFANGWEAFAAGVVAVVIALAAASPFLVAAVLALAALAVVRRRRRGTTPISETVAARQPETVSVGPAGSETRPE